MVLTEEQAKKTTCQETFAVREIRDSLGSGIREGGPWGCLGSGCMAWRWWDGSGHPDRRGYCGKAGRAFP